MPSTVLFMGVCPISLAIILLLITHRYTFLHLTSTLVIWLWLARGSSWPPPTQLTPAVPSSLCPIYPHSPLFLFRCHQHTMQLHYFYLYFQCYWIHIPFNTCLSVRTVILFLLKVLHRYNTSTTNSFNFSLKEMNS